MGEVCPAYGFERLFLINLNKNGTKTSRSSKNGTQKKPKNKYITTITLINLIIESFISYLGLLGNHRFWDLKRWGIAGEVLRDQGKDFVDGKHELYPIPQREMDTNAELVQNPGF